MVVTPHPIVEINHITYTHWNKKEPTLKNLSLRLERGTLNVLVGPGGSGKSTLCDLFNGKIPHLLGGKLEGEVYIDGRNTLEAQVKDLALKVGQVFQDPEAMFATLYVEDEIAFGPENMRVEVAEIQQITEKLLEVTQLAPQRNNLVWNLSGGQMQKLGLAVVLAMRPELVVLDEPTSNLDPAATRSVHELILSLRDEGITVLLVTRELDDFLASVDCLFVLDQGRITASGIPDQVLRVHGSYLEEIGIWLPETAEIGLALAQSEGNEISSIPLTVPETLAALRTLNVLPAHIQGRTIVPVNGRIQKEPLICGRDLRFSYDGHSNALDGVSFEIYAGELLAIVGRNGAGKSTLAKLLVGLLKPQVGSLTLFDRPAKQWKVQDLANKIALVFQNPEHQFLTDTVAEEIGYSLMAQGVSDPQEITRRSLEYLAGLGLENAAEMHPFALSAGMKRRLGVATMLVGQPQVLLVDEPTYGQDKQMTRTLMALMEEIRRQGIAVVMITHDMRLVQDYAERVIVMSEGRILYQGGVAYMFEQEELLVSANLRLTLLNELLQAYRNEGGNISGEIRNTADFVAAISVGVKPEVVDE